MNVAYNTDCLTAMREYPENYFDLAVCDPPYGDGMGGNPDRFGGRFDKYKPAVENRGVNHGTGSENGLTGTNKVSRTGGTWAAKFGKKIITWDVAPKKEYFEQLFRISKNQVIWGGNYFDLPPTRCFLIWRKTNVPQDFTMAMAEYAWTSFNGNAKVFDFSAINLPNRFHPSQKPVQLYEWIYGMFAKKGDKILDTHLGSGSSRIAAYKMNLDFTGYEIDKTYYEKQEQRFKKETAQIQLF